MSIYATHRGYLTISEAKLRLAPEVELMEPYVHDIWPDFYFDLPLVLDEEIVLPETEVMIPGYAPELASTGSGD